MYNKTNKTYEKNFSEKVLYIKNMTFNNNVLTLYLMGYKFMQF